jgi:hypothetical protein
MDKKPLNRKAYGHIPHLPDSRLGPSDKQATEGQSRIATELFRDWDYPDCVYVFEKIDGSCVAAAKLQEQIIPLVRAGYRAEDSPYLQHKYWALWVHENQERFHYLLDEGDWAVGEWCIQAHGTRYQLPSEPFYLLDIFHEGERLINAEIEQRQHCIPYRRLHSFNRPKCLYSSYMAACSIDTALGRLGTYGYEGAVDRVEGAVWRVERHYKVEFLVQYVRPDKQDGIYLPEKTDGKPIWNYWSAESVSLDHLRNKELLEVVRKQ